MELRDLAAQILFASTLEEKLQCPEVVTDERPGAALPSPAMPGRPPELRFKASGTGPADFPGLHRLEQPAERGRLLHFFANHELLATELMALVLLRFPDAPAAFRRGVLNTLQDEQRHTRLYLDRMRACGVQFGDLPVSGYFWRAVAPMPNPLDYVATLCLTFEQANLDFAQHFARGFHIVGDADTAAVLDRIYHDEIAHVAYGLKWFRRWKNPDESDWTAFCRTLRFPLSPQRAKGFRLNLAGRRAAGLDPAFIAELNVYAQSKGRTPSVFVFNPFAEAFIAQGKSFAPVRHQAQLAADLANLPQFLCRVDDLVLVPKRPAVEFLSGIKDAGFALPEFVELEEPAGRTPAAAAPAGTTSAGAGRGLRSLAHRKLGALRPWAWGPDSVALLEPLFTNVTGETRAPGQRFNDGIAALYSKAWSAGFLREFLAGSRVGQGEHAAPEPHPLRQASLPASGGGIPAAGPKTRGTDATFTGPQGCGPPRHLPPRVSWSDEPWLCSDGEVGVAVNTVAAALDAIQTIRQRGHHKVVMKEALGLAGHNAIRLWEPELLESQRRWLARAVREGRSVVVEPWLERVLDFSVQLEMSAAGLKLCGYTGLVNDLRGQFQANWAAADHARRLPASVSALLGGPPDIAHRLHRLYVDIFGRLEAELRRADYRGPLGLDAFVYRTPHGDCRLKPVVEINPRYTMGRLTVELMKQACPGSCGLFRLVNRASATAAGAADFPAFARSLVERSPLRLEGEPVPRIREGALCLNDPHQAQVCLAVFEVGRTLERLLA